MKAKKLIIPTKGQKISKANFLALICTKNQTKICFRDLLTFTYLEISKNIKKK
jgi:hypothetical protein